MLVGYHTFTNSDLFQVESVIYLIYAMEVFCLLPRFDQTCTFIVGLFNHQLAPLQDVSNHVFLSDLSS